MIRETIGEQHTVPKEGDGGEKNPEDSSIQQTCPEDLCDDGKSEGFFDKIAGESGGRLKAGPACIYLSCSSTCWSVQLFQIPAPFRTGSDGGSTRVSLIMPAR